MSEVKKIQQILKGLVHTFGKLVLSWRNDCDEIYLLLLAIRSLQQTVTSVRSHSCESTSVHAYSDTGPRLTAKLAFDLESIFSQLAVVEYASLFSFLVNQEIYFYYVLLEIA